MTPSQPGPAPSEARKAGRIAVAISWLQSLNKLVSPIPSVVRFNQNVCAEGSSEFKRSCPRRKSFGFYAFDEPINSCSRGRWLLGM